MSLLNANRYRLILLASLITFSFCVRLTASSIVTAETKTENQELVTRLFQIRNLGINEAKEKIKEFLTKDERIGANIEAFTVSRPTGEVNFLIVKDTPLKIQQISQIIEELEKKFAPLTVNLDFVDVPLSQILATIAQTTDLNIIGGEALSEKISVHLKDIPLADVFDIILKSTAYTYIREGKVIRIAPKQDLPLVTEVFELQFISAEQIKETISHLITKQGSAEPFSKFSEGKYSNFLIVTDIPESVEVIRELVKKLDRKLRQVIIEAKFCEVTLNKDDEFGIEWVLKASLTGAKGPTSFPLNKKGRNILKPPETITTTSGSITLGTMSFADFSTTVHALDTKTKVNLIASPQVAAMDGQEAEIIIGDKVPIPLYERNAETGTMEVTGYQIEDVGTVLKVTPIINSDNTVTLKIHPEVSEISSYTGPNDERPIVSSREITTVFTIADGKTIVLGGLRKQTLTKTLKQVPIIGNIIGNIPILGSLFKYKDNSDVRIELLIFITPHILEEASQKQQQAESDKQQEKK